MIFDDFCWIGSGAVDSDKPGHPPLPTRLMAGLSILNMHDLSDEDLRARWVRIRITCGEDSPA